MRHRTAAVLELPQVLVVAPRRANVQVPWKRAEPQVIEPDACPYNFLSARALNADPRDWFFNCAVYELIWVIQGTVRAVHAGVNGWWIGVDG